jgi:16S rRNA A1518/A1519 N6-dimethyltransferase RsmA/KsgA/DIM1 with predicted DNA glycosylase/AP lyase activity
VGDGAFHIVANLPYNVGTHLFVGGLAVRAVATVVGNR